MQTPIADMSISGIHAAYSSGRLTPERLMRSIRELANEFEDRNIWIKLFDENEVTPHLARLDKLQPDACPLWGIPFTLKDNIDLEGIETTAACEAFTYTPDTSATVVQRLLAAGAIPVGKANLDQFATGLNGTRSPWGPCRNSFDPEYVSGGSSAGSAVAVALGLSTFSLGTDTAGSGRIPAGFNNLLGLKPSRGLISATGVVPACRSLDCVSIFTYNSDDANTVLTVAEAIDEADAYSRPNVFNNSSIHYGSRTGEITIGVLKADDLRFFGCKEYEKSYQATLNALVEQGFHTRSIDYTPFDQVAKLLYEGPWVAERFIATSPLITENPGALHDTVLGIIESGGTHRATELFSASYRLQGLKRTCLGILSGVDCLLTPTAGKHFTIKEMLANPVAYNSDLGYYTNFVNLLDLAAVSVPALITETGLPFGVTLVGNTFSDRELLSIANRIQHALPLPMGAINTLQAKLSQKPVSTTRTIDIVVSGAHMDGLPLSSQLTMRGSIFKETTKTSQEYCLYKLPGDSPMRPALVKDKSHGQQIEVEIWSVPAAELGSFVAGIPAPLGIGKVMLEDGRQVSGFIAAEGSIHDAENISKYGSWRAYGKACHPNDANFEDRRTA